MIPSILYKYRDYQNEWNYRTLFDFEIYLPSASQFNDPYEGSIPFTYDPEDLTPANIFKKLRALAIETHPDWDEGQIQEHCYEAQKKDLVNDPHHADLMKKQHKEDIERRMGILSLTKKPLNYLMWSHYGNCHKGYCIGFDSSILKRTVKGSIYKVEYGKKIPKLKLFEDIRDFTIKQLATKFEDWAYEKEYRLIKIDAAKKNFKYPKEMIRKIYLGVKMCQTNKNHIIEFVKENEIECEIFELSLDEEDFQLNQLRIY